jgi:hypothetical protein
MELLLLKGVNSAGGPVVDIAGGVFVGIDGIVVAVIVGAGMTGVGVGELSQLVTRKAATRQVMAILAL